MGCGCSGLPDVFYLEAAPPDFRTRLTRRDARDWMLLCECPDCGTLWAVDEWEKYSKQAVQRLESRAAWPDALPESTRKRLLLAACGGTTAGVCRWAGCDREPVRGREICIDHLYEAGAR